MTERIMSQKIIDRFLPEYASAMVAYLTSEACGVSEKIFEVGGGYYSRVAIAQGRGVIFEDFPSIAEIDASFEELADVKDYFEASVSEVLMPQIIERFSIG